MDHWTWTEEVKQEDRDREEDSETKTKLAQVVLAPQPQLLPLPSCDGSLICCDVFQTITTIQCCLLACTKATEEEPGRAVYKQQYFSCSSTGIV